MANNTPTEYAEQMAFVDYLMILENQGKIKNFTALPNNVWTKSFSQRMRQKKEGLRKGFPDLCIVTNSDIVFIEMKRTKGGQVSPEQRKWHDDICLIGGNAFICYGAEQAIEVINKFIN